MVRYEKVAPLRQSVGSSVSYASVADASYCRHVAETDVEPNAEQGYCPHLPRNKPAMLCN
jgi:hypothetical protein